MLIENRTDYIKYRFQRAVESYEEALILAGNNRWNAVINRLYYACFYAVISLLLKNEIETQIHDGARKLFSMNFIKTEKVELKQGKLFSKLFDFRQKGDYGDLYDFDKETVEPLIGQVVDFLKTIENLINSD